MNLIWVDQTSNNTSMAGTAIPGIGAPGEEQRGPLPAREIILAIAEPTKLRCFAAVVMGARRTSEVAGRCEVTVVDAARTLVELERSRLVGRSGDGWYPRADHLAEVARGMSEDAVELGVDNDPEVAKVLRQFFVNGRLTGIPAHPRKRMIVLDHVARLFEPGIRYADWQVQWILSRVHGDGDTLQRYLVDAGLLTTSEGDYWRTGGTFEV